MSTLPPDGPPEYLEQGGGAPLPHEPSTRRPRRTALIAGGGIAALALVAGGVAFANWYFSSGAQPAEALPAGTLGYASIDLDPSGSQKVEAYRMLRKFPALKDRIGTADDDLREKLFDAIQADANCPGLDYSDDIEPWLGDRAAVAAVDTGAEQPSPVFVVQVKDAGKAESGLEKIKKCAVGDSAGGSSGGWSVDGDWAVIAETDKIAKQVADDAASSSLADDADYKKWTDQVGDAGVVSLYAAPDAGKFLADSLGTGMFGGNDSVTACMATSPSTAASPGTGADGESSNDPLPDTCETTEGKVNTAPPGRAGQALKDFKGMAATIRFNGGALELEVAGNPGPSMKALYGTDRGGDVVATLPEDTAAAVGVGFESGWFNALVDQIASSSGGEMSADDLIRQMSQASGLDLPGDAETLAGESAALAVGPDFSLETLANSSDASGLPVALKVKGDPEAIDAVLQKARAKAVTAAERDAFGSDSSGDMVAIGPNADYRSQVLEQGRLGDSAVFKDVVHEADGASALFFVNFDAGNWLAGLSQGDQQVADNLEPLEGLGMSAWRDGDTAHAVLRLTTD